MSTTIFGDWCWMAADGNSDAATYDPLPLDSGVHILECTVTVEDQFNDYKEVGFDGFIFTNDLSFVPDEANGSNQCTGTNPDETFSSGMCSSVNWGPNVEFSTGWCRDDQPAVDGTACSAGGDTCCTGSCVTGSSPGTCP